MVSASPGTNPQILPLPPPSPPPPPQQQSSPALTPCRKVRIQRSNSDPVLMDLAAKGWFVPPSVTLIEIVHQHSLVTFRVKSHPIGA